MSELCLHTWWFHSKAFAWAGRSLPIDIVHERQSVLLREYQLVSLF